MSKSIGNVVAPQAYVARFGVDALRYFVMREMVFGQDANFTDETFLTRYNADLANDLGNLVSRATTMIHRYCEGVVPDSSAACLDQPAERSLLQTIDRLDREREDGGARLPIQRGAAGHLGGDRRHQPLYRDSRALGPGEGPVEAPRARDDAVGRRRRRAGHRRADQALHARRGRAHAADAGRDASPGIVANPGGRAGKGHPPRANRAAFSAHRTISGGITTNGRRADADRPARADDSEHQCAGEPTATLPPPARAASRSTTS